MTSNPNARMGLRRPPYAFTEHGVAMLSSVLTSKRAVALNILIIRPSMAHISSRFMAISSGFSNRRRRLLSAGSVFEQGRNEKWHRFR